MDISKITPEDFFRIVDANSLRGEEITQFSLEYYLSESSITLYKTFQGKTFSTLFMYLIPEQPIEELAFKPKVLRKGQEMDLDQFIKGLKEQYTAIEIFEPLDSTETAIKQIRRIFNV